MARDEAPAATFGGINGKRNVTARKIGIGPDDAGFDSQGAARPASLLRNSIVDGGQQSSVAAGRSAAFKLRATPPTKKSILKSIG
jgi:hypothetical protein